MSLQKVLVVEDDSLGVEVIKIVLNNICEMAFAENGFKAVDMVKRDNYEMILMDVGLGYGMNGIETAQAIRKIENYQHTPIVALTAYAMEGDKEKFLSRGMTHYLSKPYELNDLKNLVREILSKVDKKD
jgi:CheY-like chemotaxis protein